MKALVTDSNYLCHAIYHSMPPLAFKTKSTGVIFGFMKRIIALTSQFSGYKIVFVWDSFDSIRKEVYPDYKKVRANRNENMTAEEKRAKTKFQEQVTEIKDVMLPKLGFKHNYSQEGYEADDLMASIKNNNKDYKIMLVTTDKDMYQLIDYNCMMYNPATKSIQTVNTFAEEYGCHPALWGEAKAIAGCATDNVKGVVGVAEKTAIKYLTKKLKPDSKKYKAIEANRKITEENKSLVILPLYGTMPIDVSSSGKTDRHKFIKICEDYGFKSLITEKNLNKWDKIRC